MDAGRLASYPAAMNKTQLPFRSQRLIISIAAVLSLSACAIGSNVSDDGLQKRAAQSLGVPTSQVSISEVEKEGGMAGRTNFTATTGRVRYGCYVTAVIGTVSDAICTKANGGGIVNNSNNPLLDAANKRKQAK